MSIRHTYIASDAFFKLSDLVTIFPSSEFSDYWQPRLLEALLFQRKMAEVLKQ